MSFHHLQLTVRRPEQPASDEHIALPLDIRTLLQIPQSEMFKDQATIGQMEEICEGDLLRKMVSYTSSLLSSCGMSCLNALLVWRLPAIRLVHPLDQNVTHDRLKMRILDARRLLELGAGLGLGEDQLWAGSEGRDVATDGARLEKFKAVVLLLDDRPGVGETMTPHKRPQRHETR